MEKYKVIGGGFYRYTLNNRTKRGAWLRTDAKLKRTERETFTEDEARDIIARNNSAYIKMANVKMVKVAQYIKD